MVSVDAIVYRSHEHDRQAWIAAVQDAHPDVFARVRASLRETSASFCLDTHAANIVAALHPTPYPVPHEPRP